MGTRALVVGRSWRRLAATAVVALGCLLLGVLTMPEQLRARLAAEDPRDPHCSPDSSATRCLVLRAKRERRRAAFPEAATLSRQALAREPLHLVALETLARSLDPRRAAAKARLIALIGSLSKHSYFAHSALMMEAYSQEQPDAALYHADALVRWGEVSQDSVYETVVQYVTDEPGRAAIARRLATDPPWRASLLKYIADKATTADALALLATMNRLGPRQTPAEVDYLAARLLEKGLYAELRQVRRAAISGRDGAQTVFDSGFDGLEGPATFVWQPRQVSGGEAVLGTADTNHAGFLRLEHDLFSSSDWMMQQLVLLGPGQYRLNIRAQGLDDRGSGRFVVEIACRGASSIIRMPIKTAEPGWQVSTADFTVPPDGCPAQWLGFAPVTGDRVETVQVLIDRISISASTATIPAPLLQPRRPADVQ
jgi:hypothetical protein